MTQTGGFPGARRTRLSTARDTALPALAGCALTVWLFFPGLMSPDSATQYAQVLGHWRLDDVHPPLLALLWMLTERIWPGPAPLFLLFAAGWWSAIAAFVAQWLRAPLARWAAILAIGAWPASILMLAHLWKDVAMAVALLVAVAAITGWHRRGRRWCALLALLALAAACAFRHNGIFAALPLAAWLAWPREGALLGRRAGARWLGRTGAAVLALALAPGAIVAATGALRTSPWTAVLTWDLAAMSIAAERVLVPERLLARELTVAQLRDGYVSWSNVPLFGLGRIRLSFYHPFGPEDRRALLTAWWAAVRADPGAYLAHRNAMFGRLLFGFERALPHQVVYTPERVLPRESALALPPVPHERAHFRFYRRTWSTPLFAGVPYLLLAAGAAAWAWRRRSNRVASGALVLSAWANALPLWAISGSAEFRYLLWTVLAAFLAWVPALARAGGVSPRRAVP